MLPSDPSLKIDHEMNLDMEHVVEVVVCELELVLVRVHVVGNDWDVSL